MEVDKNRIAELAAKLKSGDQSVFNELYKLTSSRAYFVALEITKNEQDAEDVLQESYIKMLEKIDSLDKPESFVSWFHHMVANKSKDSLKKKKPTLFEGSEDEAFEVIPDEDTSFSPEDNLNQDELHRAVIEVIGELTEEKRACVMLMYFEEMSVNEISESLEIPVSTVKNRLFSARKDLKVKFEKRGITSLYSAAPIGVVIWALTRTSQAISQTFNAGAASARVLSGITASGAASAATATATTASTAAATTAAASSAAGTVASTGGGLAAKIAAMTVAQKVVAGAVTVGIVSGSAVGVANVVKNEREESTTTTSFVEEVTTAPIETTTRVIEAIVISTQAESTTQTSTTKKTTTKKAETKPTTKEEPVATTAAETQPATEPSATQKPKTTKATTTRRNYFPSKASTTKKVTEKTTTEPSTKKKSSKDEETTVEEETVRKTTTTTTEAPTTTEAQAATVSVKVIDLDDSVAAEFDLSVPAGTEMTWSYLCAQVQSKGYEPAGGYEGNAVDSTAESGGSYSLTVYL